MPDLHIQEYLFQRIKEQLPLNSSLADLIAEKLFLSNDSAYRRIRGETPLVLEEAKILCEAFGISLDGLLKLEKNSISFNSIEVSNENYSFRNYLQDILSNLRFVDAASQKEVFYLTKDIPIFYNFLFTPIFSFRYFFWMKSILQHPDFVSRTFSIGDLPSDIEAMGREIIRLYNRIPSTEIWNTECINSTISQIEYYREAGYFTSERDIKEVYKALNELIEHIREQAGRGCKFLPGENPDLKNGNLHFFYNRVVLGDNTIMTSINGQRTLYLSYDVLNYLVTRDEQFCREVYAKFQMLMRRGTILSNTSEKQRNMFFNILLKKIPFHSSVINNLSL